MTSQPLVASVCVDYLSHPLSVEHLLVCYQQITRQIAHAPQSAKDAAISFQRQPQNLVEVLGQHQNLVLHSTKERPAPVGCRAQLRRMQNALWRRSSQSSLAKDVALVHPASLNWQKECDVLWLYGPLYEIDFVKQHQRLYPSEGAYPTEPERVLVQSPPQSPQGDQAEANLAQSTSSPATDDEVATTSTGTLPVVDTLATTTTSTASAATTTMTATAVAQATTVVVTEAVAEPPVEMAQEMVASAPAENSDDASAAVQTIVSPSVVQTTVAEPCSGILIRPTKSALKRQRTRTQVFDELRAFTHTPHYEALTRSLAVAFEGTTLNHTDGSQSEPISPVSSNTGPSLLIPIFPAPTKYHFRSGDRRRASFPKSASHPNRLNLNGNVNMNVNLRLNCCDNVVPGRSSSVGSVSSKQLRFSLEVQELVFMPTSPPFRISRAKPTRAHSDPAIQSTGYSSFIAPSHAHAGLHPHMQHHAGSLIATAAGSTDDSTTTFIKVQAHDSRGGKNSSAKLYLQHDDDDDFLDDFNDDYLFEDCQNYDDDEDEEDDEFNGVGTGSHRHRFSTKNAIVARRAQEDEQRKAAPGMLWQVYTAVTGVKELIAWYGSMVYHSSSL